MQKPSADEYSAGYQKYFDLVSEGDYLSLLKQNSIETIAFFERIPDEKLDYKYAEGKWTIKEVLMHIIDTERVFSYRRLVAARGDGWAVMAQVAHADGRLEEARDYIEKALSAVKGAEAPIFAWRVHIITADFYQSTKDSKAAERRCEKAKSLILQLGNSFEKEGPQRESLRPAATVRRILERVRSLTATPEHTRIT